MAITTDAAILDLLKSLDPKDKDLLLRKANMLVPETRDKVSGIISTLENKIESLREDLVSIGKEASDIKDAIDSAKPETPGYYVIFAKADKIELNISVALCDGGRTYYSQGSDCEKGTICGEDSSCFLQFDKSKLSSTLSRYADRYADTYRSYLPIFLDEYDVVLEAEAKLRNFPEIIDRIKALKEKTQAACKLLGEIIESGTYARANSIDWPLLDQYKIYLPFRDNYYGYATVSDNDSISFSLVITYNKEKKKYEIRYDYWVSSSYGC